jgi:hypothetical protein
MFTLIPDPNFFHPGSRIQGQKDSGSRSGSASKNLSISNAKNCFSALRNMIRYVHPGSGSWYFTHPGFRGQKGTGSRIRIRNIAETYKIDVFLLFREKKMLYRGTSFPRTNYRSKNANSTGSVSFCPPTVILASFSISTLVLPTYGHLGELFNIDASFAHLRSSWRAFQYRR